MSKGTILYVGNFELPDKNASAHRVVNNGKLFQALGYRVAYLGVSREGHFSGVRKRTDMLDAWEQAYPASLKQWLRHVFSTRAVCQLAKQLPELRMIIAYNTPYALLCRLKRIFQTQNVKISYDCTEWNDYAEGSLPKRLYKKYDACCVRKRLDKKCDGLIVISDRMRKQYTRCANVLQLPPLVDLDEPVWKQTRQKQDGVFEFCFAGEIENKESLSQIISAFADCPIPDKRLKIIGVQKEDYLARFSDQAKAVQKAGESLLFLGRLPHAETLHHVLSCGCYIFLRKSTLRNEAGFPTKFAEAYSCGVPIITTKVSDIARYMTNAEKGILLPDPDDPEKIRQAMTQAAERWRGRENRLEPCFHYPAYLEQGRTWLSSLLDSTETLEK